MNRARVGKQVADPTRCGDEKYREPIKVLSRINPGQFVTMHYMVSKNGRWVADKKRFFDVLKISRAKLLIYSPRGDLKDILRLGENDKKVFKEGMCFRLVYKRGPYLIYRIERENGS